MLNHKNILLILVTLLLLIGLQATFAADSNNTQIQDTSDLNTITQDYSNEITQTTSTDNSNEIQEQTIKDISKNKQPTNILDKISKNSKTENEPTEPISPVNIDESISRIYGFVDNQTFYKYDSHYDFDIYICDENNDDFYTGMITVQVDDGYIHSYEPSSYVYIALENLSYGEHTVTLRYNDEDNVHPSNQTSFKFTKSEIERINLYSTYESSYENNKVYTTNESEPMKVYLNTNNYDNELLHQGNLTLSIYDYENQEYKIIKTIHDTDVEFNEYLENRYINMIDMQTLLSYYSVEEYPISVQYCLNYTDLSGRYMNKSDTASIDVFNASEYTIEVDNITCSYDDEVSIPIVIKDSNGEIVTPEFTIYKLTDDWDNTFTFTRNGSNVIIHTNQFDGSIIKWAIQFTDGSIAKTTSELNVKPRISFSSVFDRTVYKNQHNLSIDCYVYAEEIYDSYRIYGDGKKVTVKLDDEIVETIYLEDENDYYSTIDVNSLETGEHIVTLSFEDENGYYPPKESSFKLTKLNVIETALISSLSTNPILNTDENIELNFEVIEYLSRNNVTEGTVTFGVYVDNIYTPIKTVDVTENKMIVDVDSILSNYNDITYPLYIHASLMYNDTITGQYENQTISIYFYVYEASKNTLEIPDATASIPESITIPITVKDEQANIISPDIVSIDITNDPGNILTYKEGNNLIIDTHEVYVGNHTLHWCIIFSDNTVATTTSTLLLNPSMIPRGNRTIYRNQEEMYYDLEVYNYIDGDDFGHCFDNGRITIKLDDEIFDEFEYGGYEYRYMDVFNLTTGEHRLLFIFEDENGTNSCNSTVLLNKVDITNVDMSKSVPELLNTKDTFNINFRVYDTYTTDDVEIGNVTLYVYDNNISDYVQIQTLNVLEKSFMVNPEDILQYSSKEYYPSAYYFQCLLNYTDLSGQYNNKTAYCNFPVYEASNYTIEIPEAETYLGQSVYVPVILKDNNGNIIDSDIIGSMAYNRIIIKCLETNQQLYVDELNGIYMDEYTFDSEGNYTLYWSVLFEDETISHTTSTLNIVPRSKESKLPSFTNMTVYKNQHNWGSWINVCDENSEPIYYGTLSVFLDDVLVDTEILNNDYDVYCSIELSDVSFGEHSVTITYEDEYGEHPTNSTSFNLIKLNQYQTDLDADVPEIIFTTDENFTINFTVRVNNVGEVTEGTVHVLLWHGISDLENLNTVDVNDKNVTVDVQTLLSYLDSDYPKNVDLLIRYNNISEDYSYSTNYYQLSIHDKIPVNIYFSSINMDDVTTINLTVKDYDDNNVPDGKINITGYIYGDYIDTLPFNATTTVTDGVATITIAEQDFTQYIGNNYRLTAYYMDDNNIYEDTQSTFTRTIKELLTLEINDTTVPQESWGYIPYVIKDKNGEIITPPVDSYSLDYGGDFNYNLDNDRNMLELYSYSNIGKYNLTLHLYINETTDAEATFTVTVKKLIDTYLRYQGYDVTDDSTIFNYYVTTYVPGMDWTGIVNQGTVDVILTIDDMDYVGVATVTDSIAHVTVEGLNLQDYIGHEYYLYARYHDNQVDFYDDIRSTNGIVKEKITLLVNNTNVSRRIWTHIPVTLLNRNGEEITPNNGYVTIYSHYYNLSVIDEDSNGFDIRYDGDELGSYNYTLIFHDNDEYYEDTYTDVTFTYKNSLNTTSNYLGYDYDTTSTTFNFSIIDVNNDKVTNGTLYVAFDLHNDGEIDYEGVVNVTDGQAIYKIDNFKISDYVGSEYGIYYNYTDVNKDYLGNNNDYFGTIKDVIILTAENTTGIVGGMITIPFTFKDKNGDPVNISGYIYVKTLTGVDLFIDYINNDDDLVNLTTDYYFEYANEYKLVLYYVSLDRDAESNRYIVTVQLYGNTSMDLTNQEYVYNRTTGNVNNHLTGYIYDYSNNYGDVYVYLNSEDNAIKYDVSHLMLRMDEYISLDLNELADKLNDLETGVYTLNVKYVSNSNYVNSSIVTKEIIVTGTSTISTDNNEYSYYPKTDDNIEVTIFDESNSNGTIIVYLVDDDKQTPIIAYYNMQSSTISIDSIGKLLESKYGYKLGDTATLKLEYNSDFKYLDTSQCEIQITFTEESTLIPTHIEINTTDAKVNEIFNITIKLRNNDELVANTSINVTIANQTITQKTNEYGEVVLNYTPTESGLLNISVNFYGNDIYDTSSNLLVVLVKDESQEEYIKELEDLIKQLNDTVNNQTQIIEELNESNKDLQEQLNNSNDQIADLESKLNNLTSTNDALNEQLDNITDQLTDAQNTINNQTNTINNLENQLNNATKEILDLKDKLNQSNTNNTQLKEQLTQLNNTKNQIEQELNNTQSQLAQAQNNITNLEKQVENLQDNNTKLENELKNLNNTKNQLESQLASANNNLTQANDKIEQQENTIKNLEKELNNTKTNNSQLQEQLTQAKQNNTQLQQQLKDAQKQAEKLQEQLDNTTQEIQNLEKQLNNTKDTIVQQNKTIQDQNKQIKTLNDTIKQQSTALNAANKEIEELTQKLYESNKTKNTTITISPITGKAGSITTIESKVIDEDGNPVDEGYVLYKIGGLTLKDENGNILYGIIRNGTATLNYKVPKSWYGKNLTVSALFKGTHKYYNSKTDSTDINITTGKVMLKIADQPPRENGERTQFVITATDEQGNNVKDGQILIKINGVTLNDANGKVVLAQITNGMAIIDYKLNLSTKVHNITAVYTNKGYDRTEAINTLNVTKGEAFIRINPIQTKTNTTQVTATIVDKNKDNINSVVIVAFKLNGKTVKIINSTNGVINTTIDTNFKVGSYLLDVIIGETGKYKSDRVTTTLIKS